MSRTVQPLGTYGSISVRKVGVKYAATTRYRDMDGGDSDLNRNSSLADLANYWSEEARVSGRQTPQTLDAHERNLEVVVLPALGRLRLRELTGVPDAPTVSSAVRSREPVSTQFGQSSMCGTEMSVGSLSAGIFLRVCVPHR